MEKAEALLRQDMGKVKRLKTDLQGLQDAVEAL
jgi:hypothetical protein